ncbi:MAG TPA: hypothetical protein VHH11_16720 [Gammaproteobacteria bacterium]|jgi:hypothetical protein|nr:hypothetical protein [Gammaproteobacteria bacterium]
MWSSNRVRALLTAAAAVGSVSVAFAVEDLSQLRVEPQRGQSADQLRRDRYECHNWAVEQTGQAPAAVQERDEAADSKQEKRAERANRAILGAAIGSVVGAIAQGGRHYRHDSADDVLVGAAVGAGVGAATAGTTAKSRRKSRATTEPPSDYLRALTACLEGRGYTVTMPGTTGTSTGR